MCIRDRRDDDRPNIPDLGARAVAALAVTGLVGIGVVSAIGSAVPGPAAARSAEFGTIAEVGRLMFGGAYLLPFEVASALLTVAMVGAVVLGKREI